CHREVPMSETRIWITAVFNDPHQAERYADCLGALQQADQSRHAQLNRELGLKPLLAGELEDVPVDSLTLFGAGVEVWLTTPPGASPQVGHFRDLHRLGCQLAICETVDDQDAACHLRDGFLQTLLSRITEARPGLATQVEGQLLFNRIWQPPVDASRAAAVSWLLLESGGLHDLDLSALNFGPFIQAIVAAGGRVADARVLLNAPQARQLAEQLPTLDRYLASLMELGLDVRHLIRLVEDEPAREALLLRSAQLGHSIEAIGRFIKQFFITDNPRLLELLLGSRLQRPEVQQEIWLHLLYAPPYGAWQRFDPGQKFLAPLVGAGLDINFPVQVFDSRMASTPLQLEQQFDQTRIISYLEKLGAAESLPGTPTCTRWWDDDRANGNRYTGANLMESARCLIGFAWQLSGRPLLLLGNRDEFHARPPRPATFWNEEGHPELLAGKDLEAGGTWLGVTRSGRFAALTNIRSPGARRGPRSRGSLVLDYLT